MTMIITIDTHEKINTYIQKLNNINKKNSKVTHSTLYLRKALNILKIKSKTDPGRSIHYIVAFALQVIIRNTYYIHAFITYIIQYVRTYTCICRLYICLC